MIRGSRSVRNGVFRQLLSSIRGHLGFINSRLPSSVLFLEITNRNESRHLQVIIFQICAPSKISRSSVLSENFAHQVKSLKKFTATVLPKVYQWNAIEIDFNQTTDPCQGVALNRSMNRTGELSFRKCSLSASNPRHTGKGDSREQAGMADTSSNVSYVGESMAVNGTSELDQVHQEQHLTGWHSRRHLNRT